MPRESSSPRGLDGSRPPLAGSMKHWTKLLVALAAFSSHPRGPHRERTRRRVERGAGGDALHGTCGDGQDGDLAAGADHRRRPWPHALSIRERQARSQRPEPARPTGRRCSHRPSRRQAAEPSERGSASRSRQRDQAGDLRRTPALPLRPGHQAGTDERPGLARLRRRLVRAPHPQARRSRKTTSRGAGRTRLRADLGDLREPEARLDHQRRSPCRRCGGTGRHRGQDRRLAAGTPAFRPRP